MNLQQKLANERGGIVQLAEDTGIPRSTLFELSATKSSKCPRALLLVVATVLVRRAHGADATLRTVDREHTQLVKAWHEQRQQVVEYARRLAAKGGR